MDVHYHSMQHFITESPWNHRSLLNKVSQEVSSILPQSKLTGLLIDESGWEKKGDKSVGVSPQYCGNAGKVCNSQVAVLGALSNGDYASMVDTELYLPQCWCDDSLRCEEAGIPKSERTFRKKWEIALDIVKRQKELGTPFDYVGGDGYYGNSIELAEGIEKLGYLYMLDIHSDQLIFTERPDLEIPKKKGSQGRTPTQIKPTTSSISVKNYMNSLPAESWKNITVRNTSKGELRGDYHFKVVYIWDKDTNRILRRLLLIRRTITPKGELEYKYSFTNANQDQYTDQCIAYMQAQRFFVEHNIKECKQILGMDQFQTRKWLAWQHQIALNFVVSSFILKEKIKHIDDIPLLSARDLKDMLVFKFYKQMTDEQFVDVIFDRHIRRQTDINNAYKRQKLIC
jgi:SRSO17 transposase